ncbi:MAG: GH15 [uncultured Chloroflexi bacterium]|uniref:GH15 n=1 Tax=uncultured Chloroflexota bacterium TaxID=166587 RepID=A0A6J4IS42_9CHLR|nr:MAG: GH15 [uncultured Chloroflexota bacterium]
MPRDLPLGNGSLLVNFDAQYRLRDVYFPHVGQENHTLGNLSRLGLWVDGAFTWQDEWALELRYLPDTLVTDVRGRHERLQLSFRANDAVDCEDNMLLRRFTLQDESGRAREARLFLHFDPTIGESPMANCAYYDGERQALVCYKGDRYFLLGSTPTLTGYAVGTKGFGDMQGTWRDAEDGALSSNPVASGYVDCTMMLELAVPAGGEATAHAWLAAGRSLQEVTELHEAAGRAPDALLDRTARSWRFWLGRARTEFGDLSPAVADLYRRSLLVMRTQIDNNGAIVAANDSDISAFGMDHYSYVWPRDAAVVSDALDMAGYHEAPRQAYVYLKALLPLSNHAVNGYLLHRYTPSGLVAASWHPSVGDGRLRLPIQEDGTALAVYGLCRHLSATGDVELMRDLYWRFVRPAADFMLIYRDHATGLPRPSYDLWEEKYGVFLFTCSTIYAALEAAATLAEQMGDTDASSDYADGAAELREAVATHLYDKELGRFMMMLHVQPDGRYVRERILDSSMAAVFIYGLFPATDERVARTMDAIRVQLGNAPPVGGIARHGDDYYHHINGNYAEYQGNTWFVSTLWYADWLSATGKRQEARRWLEWCTEHVPPSGILAEQIHPHSGAPLSVAPLTWSHAALVASVERYLRVGA